MIITRGNNRNQSPYSGANLTVLGEEAPRSLINDTWYFKKILEQFLNLSVLQTFAFKICSILIIEEKVGENHKEATLII